MKTTKENQLIRHFKGGWYITLGHALHTETDEELVVYKSLNSNSSQCWARPADDFMSLVETPDGQMVNRFEDVYELEERMLKEATDSDKTADDLEVIKSYVTGIKSTQNVVDCGYRMDLGFVGRRLSSLESNLKEHKERVQME